VCRRRWRSRREASHLRLRWSNVKSDLVDAVVIIEIWRVMCRYRWWSLCAQILFKSRIICMSISMPACLENDLTGRGPSYSSPVCCIIIHYHDLLARKTPSSPLAQVKLTKHFFKNPHLPQHPLLGPKVLRAHHLHINARHYIHTTFKASCCCLRSKDSWTPQPQIHSHRQPPFDRQKHPQHIYTPQPLLPFCLSPQQANKATL
jgi:hypothetical protein